VATDDRELDLAAARAQRRKLPLRFFRSTSRTRTAGVGGSTRGRGSGRLKRSWPGLARVIPQRLRMTAVGRRRRDGPTGEDGNRLHLHPAGPVSRACRGASWVPPPFRSGDEPRSRRRRTERHWRVVVLPHQGVRRV